MLKTRAIILAGGEGTRLGVLTAKRTKPAVPFAGKYRIIDFTLSNCVNSSLFDVMIVAQYRPHSLIEHIGAGGPWDLNRDFTGGVRIFTPYKSPSASWFVGTADAIQQNFTFIKRGEKELVLILSGDHIYSMDYTSMIQYHLDHHAKLTMATIQVPVSEASRFGIVGVDSNMKVTSFVEKPANPPSNLANMGVYVFNKADLDRLLWEDHDNRDSSHDFGKDIIPQMVSSGDAVYAYPFDGYWVDVGTVNSYWEAHMDLLCTPPAFDLYNPRWVIHTRTEERPPARIHRTAEISDSLVCDGCTIEPGARVIRSVLGPGTTIRSGAIVEESILLTDTLVGQAATVQRAITDKRAKILNGVQLGAIQPDAVTITMVGKNSTIPADSIVQPGAIIWTDVCESDYESNLVPSGAYIQTRRKPHEL